MILTKKSKRLGVFIFFDRDNIIDDYVIYMLESLKEAVDDIIFVSNSDIKKEELPKIEKYTKEINIRENIGLDAGAFKFVYDKYGEDYIKQYDELILINDTFFGPFEPFKNIINSMNEKDLDFWGLTANYESKDGTGSAIDGYIHSHIQTFFVAYRKSVLESKFFNDYWKKYNMKKNNSFENVVNNHESYFTYLLEKEGFKWDTYIDLSHYYSENRNYNYNIYGYSAYTLLSLYKCPFIKRKNFVFGKNDSLYLNSGIDTVQALEWIKENTDYDTNMIYKNIIRLYKPEQLYQTMNMNYIIREEKTETNKKYFILAFIEDEKSLDIVKYYLSRLNNVDYELISTKVNNKEVKHIDNFASYFEKNKKHFMNKYDYMCLLDLKGKNKNFQEVVDSNLIRVLENSIYSNKYINTLIDKMENNNIGIAYLPESVHNKYIMNITGKIFKDIKNYLYESNQDKAHNIIIRSYEGIWINTQLFKNNSLKKYTMKDLIFLSDNMLEKSNMLLCKIYNERYIINDLLCFEHISKSCLSSDEMYLSFPNKMIFVDNASIFRKIFRKIVPLKYRKILKRKMRKWI